MNVIEKIGMPAMLELCAEECTELAHACLKLSRKMRDENPTPKSEEECTDALVEEIGDVLLCIDIIANSDLVSHESIESWRMWKADRMKDRLSKEV